MASRLGLCNVCGENDAIYKCPGCETKSCSLQCVKVHKEERDCNGLRRRLKMVHKEDMDNLTLLSDYRFLEEVDHKLEANLRNPLRRHTIQRRQEKPKLPFFLFRLKNRAWDRGTTIRFLPRHFSSSRNNSTRFIVKESLIRWHVQLIFHQADVQLTAQSVSEKVTVNKLLARYLDPNSDLSDDVKEKLELYHSASFGGVSVLMKTDVQGEGMVFKELFPHKSLRLNFANKTVIEHPILYVVLKHHVEAYLEYQSVDHDDLFPDSEMTKEISRCGGLSYFDADSDCDWDTDHNSNMEEEECIKC